MPAKFSVLAVVAIPAIPIALSCNNDDGNMIKIPDSGVPIDAPVVCLAAPSYASTPPPGFSTDYAAMGSGSSARPHRIDYVSRLDGSQPTDVLYLDLWAGYGVFPADITAGTYMIGGADTKYSTCGLCVLIAADVTSQAVGDWYMASSGSVTLTNVNIATLDGSDGSAHFRGSLSNVMFEHVNKDSNGNPGDMVIADGCKSSISAGTMDGKMEVGSATGGGQNARLISGDIPVNVRVIGNRHY